MFVAYLALTGLLANGLRVVRHLGQAGTHLCAGDIPEAGREVLAAALAPMVSVGHQASLLVCEMTSAVQRCGEDEVRIESHQCRNGFKMPQGTFD